jgi:hypothetical protein
MKGCGKDFEVWHYDQDGIPTHSETLECGFALDYCEECSLNLNNTKVEE